MAEDEYLYQELNERLRAKDKEGAIEAYYQLLSEGRPLSEIIAAVPSTCDKSSSNGATGGSELLADAEVTPAPTLRTSELITQPEVVTNTEGMSEQVEGAGPVSSKPDKDGAADPAADTAVPPDEDGSRQRLAPIGPAWRMAKQIGARDPAGLRDEIGSPLRLSAIRPDWRVAKQIGLFLVPGAAVAAVTAAGVLLVYRPLEPLVVGARPVASVVYQKQTEIHSPLETTEAAITPLALTTATTGGSAAAKATTLLAVIESMEAMPAPASSAVVAASAGEASSASVIAKKGDATPLDRKETDAPVARSETTEAKRVGAAVEAERPVSLAFAPASQPTVVAAASASQVAAMAPGVAPAPPRLSATEISALLSRGDAFLETRDIASARLFYQRAADGGDGAAALRLGESFDPAFLGQAGMGTLMGDAKKAAFWYRRALQLGIRDAAFLLQDIAPDKQQ